MSTEDSAISQGVTCRVQYASVRQDGVVFIRLVEASDPSEFNREFGVPASATREMLAIAIAAVTANLPVSAIFEAPAGSPGQLDTLVWLTLLSG